MAVKQERREELGKRGEWSNKHNLDAFEQVVNVGFEMQPSS